MKLKQLAKDKIVKIDSIVLEKELRILQERIDKHRKIIEEHIPLKEQLQKEAVERSAKGIPCPYLWHADPLLDTNDVINSSKVLIEKTKRKIKIIEQEMIDRLLTDNV